MFLTCLVQTAALAETGAGSAPRNEAEPALAVSIDVDDVKVPTRGCFRHYYAMTVVPNAEVTSWDVDSTVYDSRGSEQGWDLFNGSNAPSVERGYATICTASKPGRYEIEAAFTVNYSYNSQYASANFRVRSIQPKVSIGLSDATPRKGSAATVRIGGQFNDGYPVKYGRVMVQKKVGARWITYRWSRDLLGAKGTTEVRGRAVQTITLRARLEGEGGYKTAVSKPITMRVHA